MRAGAPGRIESPSAGRPAMSAHNRAAALQARSIHSRRGYNEQVCCGRGGCWKLQFSALRASARGEADGVGVSKQRLAKLGEFFAREQVRAGRGGCNSQSRQADSLRRRLAIAASVRRWFGW